MRDGHDPEGKPFPSRSDAEQKWERLAFPELPGRIPCVDFPSGERQFLDRSSGGKIESFQVDPENIGAEGRFEKVDAVFWSDTVLQRVEAI